MADSLLLVFIIVIYYNQFRSLISIMKTPHSSIRAQYQSMACHTLYTYRTWHTYCTWWMMFSSD